MAAARKAAPAKKIRIHFENDPALSPVFELTQKRVLDAVERNPAVASLVDLSFGKGGRGFERHMRDADVLFAWRFDHRGIRRIAPRMRWIHIHGAGVEHLRPFDRWLPPGARLTNSRGVHGERANEYFLMALLMLNNHVPAMASNQKQKRWRQLFNTNIIGKTVLIVGVGNMGGGAAEYAKRVGMKVIGIRRSGKPHPCVDRMYRTKDLDRVIPQADFVMLALPLTSETEGSFGRRQIALMKRGAGLVNVGRAGVLDHAALEKALRGGRLSGAIIDVVPREPLAPSSRLWNVPNLLITPHSSSDDSDYYTPRSLDMFFANVLRFHAGRPLANQVDLALEY